MIKAHKNGSLLTFEKIDYNGITSTAMYDLKDGSFYKKNPKGTLRQVKSLTSFFSHTSANSISESFDDERYKVFIAKIMRSEHRCSSMGTFLARLKLYAHLENYALLELNFEFSIQREMSLYPKDVIKVLKAWNVLINVSFEREFAKNPLFYANFFRHVGTLDETYFRNTETVFSLVRAPINLESFKDLCEKSEHNANPCSIKRLFSYIQYLTQFEAMSASSALGTLTDYFTMQYDLNGTRKFDKYPKYLASIHDIVMRNHNARTKNYSQEDFDKVVRLDLEYTFGKFAIVCPKTPKDVIDEGTALHHCVGAYIDNIIASKTVVLFLRKRTDEETKESSLDDSLVTVEVQNGAVVQASGHSNREITEIERNFLKAFSKNKGLRFALADQKLDEE